MIPTHRFSTTVAVIYLAFRPISSHRRFVNVANAPGGTYQTRDYREHRNCNVIGVVASLIGTARRVRASRSWSEPMTLWTALVAASGDRKTPGLNVTRKALDLLESDQVAAIAAARLVHE